MQCVLSITQFSEADLLSVYVLWFQIKQGNRKFQHERASEQLLYILIRAFSKIRILS